MGDDDIRDRQSFWAFIVVLEMYVLYVLCFTHRHFFVDNSSPKEKEQRANEVKRMRTSICPSYTRCCFVHFAN